MKNEMERIGEYIAEEVSDWDDEVATRVRFKDFSGHRSDYEPILGFWRNLILGVSLHFDILFFTPAQLRNEWFNKGGLSPLCLDRVLDAMHEEGHIVRLEDLDYPTSALSRLYRTLRRSLTATAVVAEQDVMVVMAVLKNTAGRAVKRLTETHWTQSAVLTIPAFRDVCNGEADRASAIIAYLSSQRKALTLSINNHGSQIQGVKVSLSESPLPAPSSALDRYLLQLIWTTEMLHQRLSLIDQRSQKSRESALSSLKSGNRNVALRHMRAFKLENESREKCESLLSRVEEVLNVIANAESTKKVSEAIQIGAQAIKENKISVEEVEHSLQELEESIDVQKQVESALGLAASYTYVESEEDIEEEFKRLELEIEAHPPTPQAEADTAATETEEALDSLSDSFSKLEVVSTSPARKTENVELEAA